MSLQACAVAKLGFAPNSHQPMFGICRDVRFSKDNVPYKTAAASAFYPDGDKMRPGMLYIHIDPKAPFITSGFSHPERDVLVAIRAAISASNEFDKNFAALEKRGYALGTDDILARLGSSTLSLSLLSSRTSLVRRHDTIPTPAKQSSLSRNTQRLS